MYTSTVLHRSPRRTAENILHEPESMRHAVQDVPVLAREFGLLNNKPRHLPILGVVEVGEPPSDQSARVVQGQSRRSYAPERKSRIGYAGASPSTPRCDSPDRRGRPAGLSCPVFPRSDERGFAYCPAKRPTRITGFSEPCTSTRLICSSTFNRFTIAGAVQSSNSPHNRLPARETCGHLRLRQVGGAESRFRRP